MTMILVRHGRNTHQLSSDLIRHKKRIAYINSIKAAPGADGGTTAGINTTDANLIVIGINGLNVGSSTLPTDSNSNTWTPLTLRSHSGYLSRLFYSLNPQVGANHTFTFTEASSFPLITAVAYSGVRSYDQENGAASASATSIATGAIIPPVDGALFVTSCCTFGSAHSINLGFTLRQHNNSQSGVNMGGGIADIIQTTAASLSPTWSWTTATSNSAVIATFLG